MMLSKARIHRTVDLLTHMTSKALPASACGRRQFLDAFLFEAFAQFGLAASSFSVALLPLTQLAVKGAVVLPVAAGNKVGNADIEADHRSSGFGMNRHGFIVRKRQPPFILALIE